MNIRQRFIVLLLGVGLIPTLIVGVVSFVTISNQISERSATQLASIDIKQQQAISALLQSKQQQVIKLAEAYDFQLALQQYLTSRTGPNQAAVTDILKNTLSEVPELQTLHVADTSGHVIASTEAGEIGTTLPDLPPASTAYQGPDITTVQNPANDLDELEITTNLSVNSQYSATLRATFNVNDLTADLQDYTGLGATGETVITAPGAGGRQQSLFPLRFNQNGRGVTPYAAQNGQTVNYLGKAVMTSSRPMGFSNWTIATITETREALAPIAELGRALIIIFIVSSVVITVVAWYLAGVFSRPIRRIAEIAKQIGQGNFAVSADIRRSDEIGTLATSVNAMRGSLQALVTGIESQRNRLAIILNSTTDSILAIDKNGVITTANEAALQLTGLPAAELVGKPMREVFALQSENGQPLAINYAAPGTNTFANVAYHDAKDSRHYLKLIVARLADSADRPEQSIITISDETKGRELESMKLDFVSMAAHELRTPLAAIRGYIELVTLKLKASPDISNYLSQALKNSIELSGLINSLLDVSRIERGTLALHLEKTDLAPSVTKALHEVTFQAKEHRVTLRYNGPSAGCQVAADEVAIREVINNLLTNAIKYTLPGGQVTTSLADAGTAYRVTVRDTGVGIPSEALPHLFTKFYRVHGGLESGSTGTGLGLFIAKSIIERHDGQITVSSEVSHGSTFTFTIPKLTAEGLARMEQDVRTNNNETTRRHRGWVTKHSAR